MHKLEVKLKQHTPLIHFQHDQEGATLRASEVKPKLDRFILGKLSREERKIGENQGWIRSKNGKTWLDYKLRVEVKDNKPEEYLLASSYIREEDMNALGKHNINAISNTPFFAQEKQNNAIKRSQNPQIEWDIIEKKGLLTKGDIYLTISAKDSDLSQIITAQIQSFFVANNFGTRQSKGFGSFTVTDLKCDKQEQKLRSVEDLLKESFIFVYKKRGVVPGISSILSTINNDYRLLKSGRTRPYAKSKLMLYADSINANIGWDKKYIKVNTNNRFQKDDNGRYILQCSPKNRRESYSEKDGYLYYRAMLGLAEQFEFLLENPARQNAKMIVKVSNQDIQRFQSPILFKVIDDQVYLVGNEIPESILNKPFSFLVNFQGNNAVRNEPVSEDGSSLLTPESFSLKNFIAFAMNNNTNNASLGYDIIKA